MQEGWLRNAERGWGRALSRAAFGTAPEGAAFSFWAPRALRTGSGSDRREAGGTDKSRSLAPHAILCHRLVRGAELVGGIAHDRVDDRLSCVRTASDIYCGQGGKARATIVLA